MNKIKLYLIYFGLTWIISTPIILFITVYNCYSTPNNLIEIRMNMLGEANLEIIIITLLTICSCYWCYDMIKYNALSKVNNKIEKFIMFCGYSWGIISVVIIDIIMFKAYLSPAKATIFVITDMGIIITTIFSFCGCYLLYWNYAKDGKTTTNIIINKNIEVI